MTNSKLKNDISEIEISGDDCKVEIIHTDEKYAAVQYSRGVSAEVKKGSAKLVIKQQQGLMSKLLGGSGEVKIAVPGHIVPSVTIAGKKVACAVDGGIYGEINFGAQGGKLNAEEAAVESLTVNSADCLVKLSDCTVKGCAAVNIEQGELVLERVFATHVAARAKQGNIGAVGLNCRDTIFEVGEGNVTASVLGDESTFDVIVNAKEGTCNKESVNIENNDSSFKSYVLKGNIYVDFINDSEREN